MVYLDFRQNYELFRKNVYEFIEVHPKVIGSIFVVSKIYHCADKIYDILL